jgi:transmembrane sensor
MDETPFSIALTIELNWLNPAQRAQLEALVPPRHSSHNVVHFARYHPDRVRRVRPAEPPPRIQWHWPTARTVSFVAVVIACAMLYFVQVSPNNFVTGIGERRVIQLDDGSTVTLNTRSHLRVRFTQTRRDVELIDGEALFSVAHDAGRPFLARAGNTLVEAVGTQFNIYRGTAGTQVSVVEGRVRILANQNSRPLAVDAGEEALVGSESTPFDMERHPISAAELQRRLAWVNGELIFQGTSLATAVAEFNRYNRRRLEVSDPAIVQLVVGGRFQTVDPDDFIALLQDLFGVRAIPVGDPRAAAPLVQLKRGLPGPP